MASRETHRFFYYRKLILAIGLLVAVIIIGVFGYWLLEEEYNFVDAFYMTIITISTVGFREVHPLSDAGKVFTAALIIGSFGIFAFSISSITTYIISGDYRKQFIEKKMQKEINKLSGHTIVCGYGRVGQRAAKELLDHNEKVLILEENEDIILSLNGVKGLHSIKGDATEDENLIDAGIHRAKAILTTLPNDSENLYVVLTARELCKEIVIVSRATNPTSIKKLKIAGATNVILPDTVGGAHMASLVITPDINEFLDHITIQGEGDINLEEISFSEFPKKQEFLTLKELNARNRIGVNIIGFKTAEGEYIINPSPDTRFLPNSKLFVLGTREQMRKLSKVLEIKD